LRYDGAPERLVLDSIPPDQPARLLFFQGRSAQPTPEGNTLVPDGAGGVLMANDELRVRRLPASVDGREIASAASGPDGASWLITGDGEVLLVDETGNLLLNQAGPFEYALVASDAEGTAWLVRSPEQFAFRPEFGSTPLLAKLDHEGEVEATLGSGVIPADFLLSYLASSGRIAVGDGVIYYAPFIRDQVIALSMNGDTLWVTARQLPQAVGEPRLEIRDGDAAIDYAPVNLGMALGPDGRLYVLSVPGFTTSESRLDVFDPASGELIRSTVSPDPLPTLAADAEGRVYQLDAFRLLTGVPSRERQPFKGFDLPTLTGAQLTSGDIRGKVALVNFWASWCGPCRVEMPALDSLQRSIDDDEFVFFTMNEDVNPESAGAFMREHGFDFPVVLGRGELKREYHYIGLPFTVLLDREGKVIDRWIGYAGEEQIQLIRTLIAAELEHGEGGGSGGHEGHGDGGEHDRMTDMDMPDGSDHRHTAN
jgi:thiol-disulfide isomerase/thioredoxin